MQDSSSPVEMLRCSGNCAARVPQLLSNFHGAGWLNLILVVIAVAADTAHLVAIV
jgi:hypothetical protein